MARRRLTTLVRRTPNRNWVGIFSSTTVTVPAASKVLLGSLALSNPGIDETALRVRGGFLCRSDQSAASEDQIGAIGLIVVSDRAIVTGITAIPGPVTDSDDDGWFTHQWIQQKFVFKDATGFDSDDGHHYPFETKGKRITHDGQSIAIVAENIHATHGFNVVL